jgi:hypothetical protein
MNSIFKNILTALSFQIIPLIFGSTDIAKRVDPNFWKAFLILSILISWLIGLYYYIKYPLPKKVGNKMWKILFLTSVITNYGLAATCSRYFGFEYESSVEVVFIIIAVLISFFEIGIETVTKEYDPDVKGVKNNYYMDYYAIMGYAFYIDALRNTFREINIKNVSLAIFIMFLLILPFKKYSIAIGLVYAKKQKERPFYILSLLLVILSALSVMFGRKIGIIGL